MTTHLEQELEKVKARIYEMSDLAIEAIIQSVDALKQQDVEKAEKIIQDDSKLDRLELQIDDDCTRIMVTQQPAAIDMRMVLAFLKMNTDLERIGDLATSIAKETIKLSDRPLIKSLIDIPRMSTIGIEMIRKSLEAMSAKDAEKATNVISMDKQIDELNMQIYRELFSFMVENPHTISQSLSLIMVSRSLERIGDHAANIAERVIYYIEGVDVRHSDI